MVKVYKSGNAFMLEQAQQSRDWINLWHIIKPRDAFDSRSCTPSSLNPSPTPLSMDSASSSIHSYLDDNRTIDHNRYQSNSWRFWYCPHATMRVIPEVPCDMSPQLFHLSMFDTFRNCLRKSEQHLYSLNQLKWLTDSAASRISSFVKTNSDQNQIMNGESFFCFREGILPLWEDEYNVNGGCWSLKLALDDPTFNAVDSQKLWLMLISLLTSPELSPYIDEVCGVGLTVRIVNDRVFYKLTLWNRDSNKFFVNLEIGHVMRDVLGFRGVLSYLSHSTNMNKFAANAKRKYHYRLRNSDRRISFTPNAFYTRRQSYQL